jgi:hypothetical protein
VFLASHVTVEEFSDVPVAFASHETDSAEVGVTADASPFGAVPVAALGGVDVVLGEDEVRFAVWSASAYPTVLHMHP